MAVTGIGTHHLQRRIINTEAFVDLTDCPTSYWFGFIYADGCVEFPKKGNPRFGIDLKPADSYHLVELAKFLGDTYRLDHIEATSQYEFNNAEFCQRLVSYGLTPRHKTSLKPPPDSICFPCFLRGFSDGDGCFHAQKPYKTSLPILRWIIAETSKEFSDWLVENLSSQVIPPTYSVDVRRTGLTQYRVQFSGVKAHAFRDWLYNHCNKPTLERKFVIAYSLPPPALTPRNQSYYHLLAKYV